MKKDLVSITDLTAEEVWLLVRNALEMKRGSKTPDLEGQTMALLFEKPSLRTRVSFDVAMHQLGGHTIYLSPAEVGLGTRESIRDVATVLSRYVDCIVSRTFAHSKVEGLATYATVPVINGLSDSEHPCQALGDLLTIYEEKGKLEGLSLAFVGDGNNVASSLALGAALVGMEFTLVCPKGYELPEKVSNLTQSFASKTGARLACTHDPSDAVKTADVVYADVWTSMGQEEQRERRLKDFAAFQVSGKLLDLAKKDAIFMHPLPAHHGEEIEQGLLDHPKSVVFDQAENRLHIQKAILVRLLSNIPRPKIPM